MHEHSTKAYRELSDHLTGRRAEVYAYIEKNGQSTDAEVKNGLGFDDMNQVRPRITELLQHGLLIEGPARTDKKTGRKVRTVKIEGQCSHEMYKGGNYMTAESALKAMKAGKICYIGETVKTCSRCGYDLSEYNVKRVMTPDQYMVSMGMRK